MTFPDFLAGLITKVLKESSSGLPAHSIDSTGLSSLERRVAQLEEELLHARAENRQLRERGMRVLLGLRGVGFSVDLPGLACPV